MIDQQRIIELGKIITNQRENINRAKKNILWPAEKIIENCNRLLLEICLIDLKCKAPNEHANLQLDALETGNFPYEWVCEESLIGKCIYDNFEDPCLDSCLYCGDPYERK